MLKEFSTLNVTSSVTATPPTRLPAILIVSRASYPDPPFTIEMKLIPPLLLVRTETIHPDPPNSPVVARFENVVDGV